jgi:exopolysaccharide production protein ExoQ
LRLTTRSIRLAIERSYAVIALLLLADALLTLLRNPTRDMSSYETTTADPVRTIALSGLYAALLLFLIPIYPRILRALRRNCPLLALSVLSIVSASWSPQPGISLKRALLLLATTLFGVYFAVRFENKEQLTLLAVALAIALGGGTALAILSPDYGTQYDYDGAWRGVFIHRNAFGRISVLSAFVFYFMSRRAGGLKLLWLAGIPLAALGAVMSRSATAVAGSLGICLALCGCYATRLPRRLMIPVVCLGAPIFIVLAWLAASQVSQLPLILGRDPTLTGRTELWRALEKPLAKNPWLGYGYGGFWLGPNSDAGDVADLAHWEATYAHDGFLDLTLELGRVGLAIMLCTWILYASRAIRWAQTRTTASWWPCCYFAFMLCFNLTDSTLLEHNSLFWALFVSTGISVTQATDRRAYQTAANKQQSGNGLQETAPGLA